ncbi:hypothetical protein AMTRI_Chr09g36680 [Amborella trichopoda]
MAEQHKRPVVLLKDPIMPSLEKALQLHFDLLKPWDSGQPLHSFLVSHAHLVSAVLCRGWYVCRRRGVAVGNLGAVFAEEVADYAIGLLLAVLHRIAASDRNVRQGHFCSESHSPFGTKLSGKLVGIVLLGSIGLAIAKRLEPFGCTISDALLALGKNGVLINVARGAVIDEKEMVRCLVEGELGGAGLDVFENEPHVPHGQCRALSPFCYFYLRITFSC